ncbi:MAG: alpha/beta hydrolase [Candidatus Omnitrophica bacterium]|nr:alpha/beta hydrolase [Candidatus Omnitrophota bacterium]
MTSAQTTTFKFINRGQPWTIVLIPGWGSDHRIFEALDLEYNYLIVINFVPESFQENLIAALKEHDLNKVSLLGWSLGGFVACEFSAKYDTCVDELILISIRKKYEPVKLKQIKEYLNQNKKGYLHQFYNQCFHDSKLRSYFKKNYAKEYYNDFQLDVLINGIDYLSKAEIKTESLKKIKKIKIIHGEFDSIAPLDEAKKIKDSLEQAEFIVVDGAGHMPFLRKDFSKYIK